jgi:hypothetical protein
MQGAKFVAAQYSITTDIYPALVALHQWLRGTHKSERWFYTLYRHDCQTLVTFCRDPEETTLGFKMPVDRRKHLQRVIQLYQLDLDCDTIRLGSPHTLRVTKNLASYKRAIAQNVAARERLKRLQRMEPFHLT